MNGGVEKTVRVLEGVVRGYDDLRRQLKFTRAERRALHRRLSRQYFWQLGYAGFWQHGRRREALEMYRRGLRLCPWNLWYLKTYALAWLRSAVAR
jgi:hypothetical protein